jgi:heterodisulfide reductase subunit C
MRAVQLGLKQEVLSSSTIWLCLFCHTCTARCPLEIDISRVMESLRLLAAAEGSKPAEKEVKLFHTIFLRLVQRFGRIYEFGLGGLYNLLSRHPGTNAGMLPLMLAKGKLALLPPRARGVSQIRTLFARVEAKKRESMLSGDKVERK